jgi:hypothetical protein
MPQNVEFNGEVIEFPDDMSDDAIAAVLQKQSSPVLPKGAEKTGLPGVPSFVAPMEGGGSAAGAAKLGQEGLGERTLKAVPRTLAAIGEGVFGAAEGLAGAVQGLGDTAPVKAVAGSRVKDAAKAVGDLAGRYSKPGKSSLEAPVAEIAGQSFLDDPSLLMIPEYWLHLGGSAMGSMIPTMIPGMAGAKAGQGLAALSKVSARYMPALKTMGGAAASSFVESAMDAGSTYREALDAGASPEQAAKAASTVMAQAFATNTAFGAAGTWNDSIKGWVRRTLASIGAESTQEGATQVIQNAAARGYDPSRPLTRGVDTAMLGGALGGAVVGPILAAGETKGASGETDPAFTETKAPKPGTEAIPGETIQQEVKRAAAAPKADFLAGFDVEKYGSDPEYRASIDQAAEAAGFGVEPALVDPDLDFGPAEEPPVAEEPPGGEPAAPVAPRGLSVEDAAAAVDEMEATARAARAAKAKSVESADKPAPDKFGAYTDVDWGSQRGQGKRSGGMVQGAMSTGVRGRKTYYDPIGKLPEVEQKEAKLLDLTAGLAFDAYVQARNQGFDHNAAMVKGYEAQAPSDSIDGPARKPKTEPAYGRETKVSVGGENRHYMAQYALVEADDAQPSYNPFNFNPNENYLLSNERGYNAGSVKSGLVIERSSPGIFDQDLVLSDAPTAEHGTPILAELAGMSALSGNERTGVIQRVYRRGGPDADRLRASTFEQAKALGVSPDEFGRFKNPMLSRVRRGKIDAVAEINDYNKPSVGGLEPAERAVADGRRLSLRTIEEISARLEDLGEEGTLAAALRGADGASVLDFLEKDGMITGAERGAHLDERKFLTPDIKARIGRALVGRLFPNPKALENASPAMRGKLERAAPHILRVEGRADWNVTESLREALAVLEEAKMRGKSNLDDLVNQPDLDGNVLEVSPSALMIAKKLNDGPLKMAAAFRRYANDEALSRPGAQKAMWEPPTQAEAFADAFGEVDVLHEMQPETKPPASIKVLVQKLSKRLPKEGTGKADWRTHDRVGDRPAILVVNRVAMHAMGLKGAAGVVLPAGTAQRYAAKAKNQRLSDAMFSAIAQNDGKGVIVVRSEGRTRREIMRTVRHELTHWQQFAVGEGTINSHIDGKAIQKHPLWKKISDNIRKIGYKGESVEAIAAEAGAFISAGQLQRIGVTIDEAVEFLAHYIAVIKQQHGEANAISVLRYAVGKVANRGKRKSGADAGVGRGPGGDVSRSGDEGGNEKAPPAVVPRDGTTDQEKVVTNPQQGSFFDPDQLSLFEREKMAGAFYSQLSHVINMKMPNRASVAQVRAMVANPQNGIKPDEIKWTGLDDFLAGKGMIEKADLEAFLAANAVQVREVEGPKKFAQYALPGGENYRELLLTLPNPGDRLDARRRELEALGTAATPEQKQEWADIMNRLQPDISDRERAQRFKGFPDYRSPHWDEPNVLAHIRFDERKDAAGRRVLHVAEIQSDWHQEGRKKGYESAIPPLTEEERSEMNRLLKAAEFLGFDSAEQARAAIRDNPDWATRWDVDEDTRLAELGNHYHRSANKRSSIPQAPFAKNWHELAFRRAVRWAAEHGFDALTWDTGETAAERFDLSKQVERIVWGARSQILTVFDKKNEQIMARDGVKPEDLEGLIGKEIARRLIEASDAHNLGVGELRGVDLKVGGEGMKGFYDEILPAYAKKFGKKFGATVEDVQIEVEEKSLATQLTEARDAGNAREARRLRDQLEEARVDFANDMEGAFRDDLPALNNDLTTDDDGYQVIVWHLRRPTGEHIQSLREDASALGIPMQRLEELEAEAKQWADDENELLHLLQETFGTEINVELQSRWSNYAERIEEFEGAIETKEAPAHSLTITPEMRASVVFDGQPLFEREAANDTDFLTGEKPASFLKGVEVYQAGNRSYTAFSKAMREAGVTGELAAAWSYAKKVAPADGPMRFEKLAERYREWYEGSRLKDVVDFGRPLGSRVAAEGDGAGTELMHLVTKAGDMGERLGGELIYRLDQAGLAKLSKPERFALLDALEGRGPAPTGKIAEVFRTVRAVTDEVAAIATGAGVMVRGPKGKMPFAAMENYFPHVIRNADALSGGQVREDVIQNVVRLGEAENEADAAKLLDAFIAFADSGARRERLLDYLVKSGQAVDHAAAFDKLLRWKRDVKRHGNLEFERVVNLPFYDPDPVRVLPHHVVSAGVRLAQVATFGQESQAIHEQVYKIAQAGGRAAEVQKAVDRMIGVIEQGNSWDVRLARTLTAMNTLKLGLAAIPNSTQGVLNSMLAADLGSLVAGLRVSFGEQGRAVAVRSGATIEPVLAEMTREFGEGGLLRRLPIVGPHLTIDNYLKSVGFAATERFNRTLAANVGFSWAGKNFERLKARPKDAQARKFLTELGIDADGALKAGGLTEEDLLRAAKKFSDVTQFRSRPQDMPEFASTPWGRVVFQFKSFAFHQAQLVAKQTAGELRSGNVGRGTRNLLILGALFPAAGQLVKILRNGITGREDKEFESAWAAWWDAMGQAGALGIMMDGTRAAMSGRVGRVTGFLAGPSAGFVDDAAVLFTTLQDPEKDGEAKMKAIQRWYRRHGPLGSVIAADRK